MSTDIETSLRDTIKQSTEQLKNARSAVEAIPEDAELSTEACQELTDNIKEMLLLLQSTATRISDAGLNLDIPFDIEVSTKTEEGDEQDNSDETEDEDDSNKSLYIVKINDDVLGYVDSEEEAISFRDTYSNLLQHSFQNLYETRSELSDDGSTITFYGSGGFFLMRWERLLSTVSYHAIDYLNDM